jgi:phage protein U
MKTGEETGKANDLEKVRTNRSSRSVKMAIDGEGVVENPYAIDRVATNQSLARMASRSSKR